MTALFEQLWTDLFLEIQRMIFASSVYALDMIYDNKMAILVWIFCHYFCTTYFSKKCLIYNSLKIFMS